MQHRPGPSIGEIVLMNRVYDIGLSCICLFLALLPMACITVAIQLCDGWPVLFSQTRIGQEGHPFRIFKFRTMHSKTARGNVLTLHDDSRVSRLGGVLRASRLDELPQLFNILSGSMSFIGPRPEIPQFVDLADSRWHEVLQVKPGLFDEATYHCLNEAALLSQADDWRAYYREVLLPKKLTCSLASIRMQSLARDIGLLLKMIRYMFRRFEER
jgi:lipopolysaccharide/colanic/teichoic acid biosynthesis glycosyltransferase